MLQKNHGPPRPQGLMAKQEPSTDTETARGRGRGRPRVDHQRSKVRSSLDFRNQNAKSDSTENKIFLTQRHPWSVLFSRVSGICEKPCSVDRNHYLSCFLKPQYRD